jgi:hypothetical protein
MASSDDNGTPEHLRKDGFCEWCRRTGNGLEGRDRRSMQQRSGCLQAGQMARDARGDRRGRDRIMDRLRAMPMEPSDTGRRAGEKGRLSGTERAPSCAGTVRNLGACPPS